MWSWTLGNWGTVIRPFRYNIRGISIQMFCLPVFLYHFFFPLYITSWMSPLSIHPSTISAAVTASVIHRGSDSGCAFRTPYSILTWANLLSLFVLLCDLLFVSSRRQPRQISETPPLVLGAGICRPNLNKFPWGGHHWNPRSWKSLQQSKYRGEDRNGMPDNREWLLHVFSLRC